MARRRIIVWLRNDLRLHDNPLLSVGVAGAGAGAGGRARTTHLVSECDLTCAATACTGSTRAPATVTAATVSALTDPLQGGSATHWAQMADLKTALTHSGKTPCPA